VNKARKRCASGTECVLSCWSSWANTSSSVDIIVGEKEGGRDEGAVLGEREMGQLWEGESELGRELRERWVYWVEWEVRSSELCDGRGKRTMGEIGRGREQRRRRRKEGAQAGRVQGEQQTHTRYSAGE
jgi:hypothetical protein